LRRLGIFGGTFNPVHLAHLIIAEDVREQVHLDKVIFIPSANPPHKQGGGIPEANIRLHMIDLAIRGNPYFESSDIEILNAQFSKSYTVNTLLSLREKYKDEDVKLYLMIGMDNLIELHTWKDPGKLFMLSEVVVMNRPGYLVNDIKHDFGRQALFVPAPDINISSTDIRQRIAENRSIKYLVPEEVEKYIAENKLYQ
jgi:nicotinate-nucleotide adenylyltransferase